MSEVNMTQDFETEFTALNYPDEFLPNWYANEVRSTSSRIYQANGLGKNGSRAMAVQPISSFNGEVFVRLSIGDFDGPKVRFLARSVRNGSGNRAAEVYYSWGADLAGGYNEPVLLGEDLEFPNEDQEFRVFELVLPDNLNENEEVFLRLEIRYGSGSGSCAKWVMDDFEFGEFEEDTTPPKVDHVRGFDENQLEVQFDEAVDPVFSVLAISYKLDGVEPSYVELKSDSLVYLSFDERLEIGREFSLSISQIPDLEGNFLRDTLILFQFFDPTYIPPKMLVLNEIMPAPRADLDLPNVEYVEVFNAGEYAVRMGGVGYSNSRSSVVLLDKWILPSEYLILAPQNQVSLLEEYGMVLPVTGWPTLLNSGDQLSLIDDQGGLIDMLSYSTRSWGGSEFAGGGYSLEVANPYNPCDQSDNLKPSQDPARGTPGRKNSVFDLTVDSVPPILNSAEFSSAQSLMLTFSKPIIVDGLLEAFSFDPFLEVDSVAQVNSKQIQLMFSESIIPNTIYHLSIHDLIDCDGNVLAQSKPWELVLPVQAQVGDVIINELLANPKTGSPKFVEVKNVTDNFLELKHWKLANLNNSGEINQIRQFSELSSVISPQGYLAITTDTDLLKLDFPKSASGSFLRMSSLPSYPISGGTVVLLDSAAAVADMFSYSEDLHHPLLRNPKGVSLERLSTETPSSSPANWHSASATEEYGTPGRKNSQVVSGEFTADLIQIVPEVFDPEGSNGNTFAAIRYELNQSGWIGNFSIYTTTGQLVQVLAQNELLGSSGLFTWTGTDSQGKIVRPGYYILMVELYDLSGEQIIVRKTIVVATRL
ncbi:lamin tail domain-containing protein [Algoriphagus sp.]|uniref:lamin tail domain-containing protein n=1 Tax=Algoriphagus sp. TaxID=1872435 RepID=UPI003F6F92B2